LIDGFTIEAQITLNNDTGNPVKPATTKVPYIQGNIIIGDKMTQDQLAKQKSFKKSKGNGTYLNFFLFQPQILRISKTLEIIGHFNEFKEGV